MKYRLALKLGVAEAPSGKKPESTAYVSWALIRLSPPIDTGSGQLPYDALQGPGEACIVVYDRPEDMCEPMPLEKFEERLNVFLCTLPKDCTPVLMRFDKAAFAAWLKKGVSDSHEARAEWALQAKAIS